MKTTRCSRLLLVMGLAITACFSRSPVMPVFPPESDAKATKKRAANDLFPVPRAPSFKAAFEPMQSNSPRDRRGRPFESYVRLQSTILDAIEPDKCVDDSLLSWLRKTILGKHMGMVALIATVRGPRQNHSAAYPLFVSTVTEKTSECVREFTEGPITPFYLVRPRESFKLTMSVRWAEERTSGAIARLMKAASNLLNLVGANGSWLSLIEPKEVAVAARAVDESLSKHWTRTSATLYNTLIDAHREDGVWKDGVVFRAPLMRSTARGITVDHNKTVSVKVDIEYVDSFFASKGEYPGTEYLLDTQIAPGTGVTLSDILFKERSGSMSGDAELIDEPAELDRLCRNMIPNLAKYFTRDDALAARFTFLKWHTKYEYLISLRETNCLTDADRRRLVEMNQIFSFANLERQVQDERDEAVEDRMQPISKALRRGDRGAFHSQLESARTFLLFATGVDVSQEQNMLDSELSGYRAIDHFLSAKIRSGCYMASPDQNLDVVAMVIRAGDNEPTAMYALFNDEGKLRKLTEVEIALVREEFAEGFAGEKCRLLPRQAS